MNQSRFQKVEYLGDAVYVGHDGYQVWVWTTDGITESEAIALEPNVMVGLNHYVARLKEPETP